MLGSPGTATSPTTQDNKENVLSMDSVCFMRDFCLESSAIDRSCLRVYTCVRVYVCTCVQQYYSSFLSSSSSKEKILYIFFINWITSNRRKGQFGATSSSLTCPRHDVHRQCCLTPRNRHPESSRRSMQTHIYQCQVCVATGPPVVVQFGWRRIERFAFFLSRFSKTRIKKKNNEKTTQTYTSHPWILAPAIAKAEHTVRASIAIHLSTHCMRRRL